MMTAYQEFLARKGNQAIERGIEPIFLASHLFPYQRHTVEFCLRTGTAGLFLDTGLGKTECQLEWCQQIINAVGGRALIATPLAVAGQTKRRADRWGYTARVVRHADDVRDGINICNYDRLERLDLSKFTAVSLDEASILKSFTGKTTQRLIDAFANHRFKLVATATPAPNDHMELGNYAEFLGLMSANEMLSRFFINDTSTASQKWRIKGHARTAFWDWMASWSRMATMPSDLGDSDDGFVLPPFELFRHRAEDSAITNTLGDMFGVNMSATNVHEVKRQTSMARAKVTADIVNAERQRAWIIWVDTNYEADEVRKLLPNAIEVRGSMDADEKERRLEAFSSGTAPVLISKPSVSGFGMDWSHCDRMIFVGRSYSYEAWYQAVRRCWRFGQKNTLHVHIVVAEGEAEIGRVIERKADDHETMKEEMRAAMLRACGQEVRNKIAYEPTHRVRLPEWMISSA